MNKRIERINSQIQKIVSKVISELSDPELKPELISVIGVRTSADLSYSKIFISILADDNKQESMFLRIKKAEPFIQRRLTEELDIRKTPEIKLIYNESIEHGERILQILNKLKEDNLNDIS